MNGKRTASSIVTGASSSRAGWRAARRCSVRCCIWARSTTARKRPGARASRSLTRRRNVPSNSVCSAPTRSIAADEVNALSLVLSEMRLLRAASFGDCWLGCLLWDELGLDRSGRSKLASDRGGRAVGEGAAVAGGQPAVRSEQRVRGASPRGSWAARWMSCWEWTSPSPPRTGCIAAWIGSAAQGCAVPVPRRAVEDAVRRQLRRAALRSDQHLLRGELPGDPQGQAWLQPRRPVRLPAGGDRAGGDHRWTAAGVRGAGGQHRRQDHACRVSGEDPVDVRQGPPGVGDGPRHPHRGDAGADAPR